MINQGRRRGGLGRAESGHGSPSEQSWANVLSDVASTMSCTGYHHVQLYFARRRCSPGPFSPVIARLLLHPHLVREPKVASPPPSSQRLPASPRQEARFPRGIAFPPHVASPIRSDLSSPAKEWDRLVAGASPLDCLLSAAITRTGQQHGPRGEAGCQAVQPRPESLFMWSWYPFLIVWYRHGIAVSRKSSPDPRSTRLVPRPSVARKGEMIGRVALKPFAPLRSRRAGSVHGAG